MCVFVCVCASLLDGEFATFLNISMYNVVLPDSIPVLALHSPPASRSETISLSISLPPLSPSYSTSFSLPFL